MSNSLHKALTDRHSMIVPRIRFGVAAPYTHDTITFRLPACSRAHRRADKITRRLKIRSGPHGILHVLSLGRERLDRGHDFELGVRCRHLHERLHHRARRLWQLPSDGGGAGDAGAGAAAAGAPADLRIELALAAPLRLALLNSMANR